MPNRTNFPHVFVRLASHKGERRMLATCLEHGLKLSSVKGAIIHDWGLEDVVKMNEVDLKLTGNIFGADGVTVRTEGSWSWLLYRLEDTTEAIELTLCKRGVTPTYEQ